MHLLALLDKPTKGQIIIDGKDSTNLSSSELNKLRNKNLRDCFSHFDDDPYRLKFTARIHGIEFINDDELLEVTPKSLRLRKRILNTEINTNFREVCEYIDRIVKQSLRITSNSS